MKHIIIVGSEGTGKTLAQETIKVTFGAAIWPIDVNIKHTVDGEIPNMAQRVYRRGLEAGEENFSWDGAVRTTKHAEALMETLINTKDCLCCAIVLTASEDVCSERLLKRNGDRVGVTRMTSRHFSDYFRAYTDGLKDIVRILLSKGVTVFDINTTDLSASEVSERVIGITRTFLAKLSDTELVSKTDTALMREKVLRTQQRRELMNSIQASLCP